MIMMMMIMIMITITITITIIISEQLNMPVVAAYELPLCHSVKSNRIG